MSRQRIEVPREVEEKLPEHLRIEAIHSHPGKPSSEKPGASGEYMRAIRERKLALAEIAPEYADLKGGRPRTKVSRKEAEENAMARMLPRAISVLEEQLDSLDEKVRQSAAVKVLEYVKGKPTQTINQELHQVTKIVYESAAWVADDAIEVEGVEVTPLELPEGDPIAAA